MGKRHPRGSLGPHGPACLIHPCACPETQGTKRLGVSIMCKYMLVKSERKRQNGSGAVVRGGSAEARAVRNGPMSVTCLPPRTRVTSGPGMLPTAISGSATLRFLLTSMTSVATKATGMSRVWVTTCGHHGIHGLCRHWGHVVEWPGLPLRENDDIRPGLLLGATSRSVSL